MGSGSPLPEVMTDETQTGNIARQISITPEMAGAVSLGILEFEGVRIQESPPDLREMLESAAKGLREEYRGRTLGEIPAVKAVRTLFHRTGVDPTRYRPSSESLLRRAVNDKPLYVINSAVDIVNYFSLRTLFPMGLFDADRIRPPMEFRAGRAGETYEGVGRDVLNLSGFPLVADAEGPFGSAVSDSVRTRVTTSTTRLVWIVFAPPGTILKFEELTSAMLRFNGGAIKGTTQL